MHHVAQFLIQLKAEDTDEIYHYNPNEALTEFYRNLKLRFIPERRNRTKSVCLLDKYSNKLGNRQKELKFQCVHWIQQIGHASSILRVSSRLHPILCSSQDHSPTGSSCAHCIGWCLPDSWLQSCVSRMIEHINHCLDSVFNFCSLVFAQIYVRSVVFISGPPQHFFNFASFRRCLASIHR